MKTTSNRSGKRLLIVVCTLFCVSISGCGETSTKDPSQTHLGVFAQLYDQFRARNRGRRPADADELRQFASKSNLLEANNIESFDELLVSDRDAQTLTLLYGNDVILAEGAAIIGYETQGIDGKRVVAYEGGFVEEVNEARFSELVPSR